VTEAFATLEQSEEARRTAADERRNSGVQREKRKKPVVEGEDGRGTGEGHKKKALTTAQILENSNIHDDAERHRRNLLTAADIRADRETQNPA
jgi:hypothetical protein